MQAFTFCPQILGSRSAACGRGGNDTGQSLVELALLTPLLLLILIGAIEFGRMGYAAIEVANAARAGTTYGAQNPSDFSGMVSAALSDSSDIAGWENVTVTATATQACSCSDGTAISCSGSATCSGSAHLEKHIQVQSQATVDPLFHVQGLPSTYTLYGNSTVRVRQ